MTLKELSEICVDKVSVYIPDSNKEYKTIYGGYLKDAPKSILDRNIRLIGARNKTTIDVEIFV